MKRMLVPMEKRVGVTVTLTPEEDEAFRAFTTIGLALGAHSILPQDKWEAFADAVGKFAEAEAVNEAPSS